MIISLFSLTAYAEESSGFESVENLKMAGTTYMNGFTLSRDGYALFNLDKKYSTFDFDIGHVDGTEMSTAIITAKASAERTSRDNNVRGPAAPTIKRRRPTRKRAGKTRQRR
jgi:hypothetical protein